ncbi:MAG TPA: hypothetical protein VFW50_39585 [Streptosporangiaceae bacterium]|nr:hypothetical protein [Streptosporangiaceae bacterium]
MSLLPGLSERAAQGECPAQAFAAPLIGGRARVSLRIVTMPIQSQGIITRDNGSVDVSAVAYYRVVGAIRSGLELVAFLARENGAARGGTAQVITQPDGAAAR